MKWYFYTIILTSTSNSVNRFHSWISTRQQMTCRHSHFNSWFIQFPMQLFCCCSWSLIYKQLDISYYYANSAAFRAFTHFVHILCNLWNLCSLNAFLSNNIRHFRIQLIQNCVNFDQNAPSMDKKLINRTCSLLGRWCNALYGILTAAQLYEKWFIFHWQAFNKSNRSVARKIHTNRQNVWTFRKRWKKRIFACWPDHLVHRIDIYQLCRVIAKY